MRLLRALLWVIGVPNLLGILTAIGLGTLVMKVFPTERRRELLAVLDVFSGIMTVLSGVLIARSMGLSPAMWLPLISTSWFAIHFTVRQRIADFIYCSFGILGGWGCYVFFAGA